MGLNAEGLAPLPAATSTRPGLVVSGNRVLEGTGGPIYRATGYNATFLPNIYTTAQTLTGTAIDRYFASLRPNSLTRLRAYAPPVASGISWAQQLATLDNVVTKARAAGQRLILCFTNFGTVDQTADAFHPNAAWVTGQQYLNSVTGSLSYEDWVKTVVPRYTSDGTVSIYDLCNEPVDAGAAITAALRTWFETARGWVQAIDPTALVYVGFDTVPNAGGSAAYQSINTNMDLCGSHEYNQFGWVPTTAAAFVATRALSKPLIFDEIGAWAKPFYGTAGDSDLGDTGRLAVDHFAQGKLLESQILSTFGWADTVANLVYSYMDDSVVNGAWSDNLGHYEPPNESLARKVVKTVDLTGDSFSSDVLSNLANGAWVDCAFSLNTKPGTAIVTHTDRAANVDYTQTIGPLAGRWNNLPTYQFGGTHGLDINNRLNSGDANSSRFYAFVPTALPGAGAFGYLLGPQTTVTSAAIRINSSGNVELLKYAAATTGTIVGTSATAVLLNQVNVLSVVYASATGVWEIVLNGVRASGTSIQTLTTSNGRIGAAGDGTNGFVGHLLHTFQTRVVEAVYDRGRAYAFLQRKYAS